MEERDNAMAGYRAGQEAQEATLDQIKVGGPKCVFRHMLRIPHIRGSRTGAKEEGPSGWAGLP